MRVLVLGAQGMAGHMIKRYLKQQDLEVYGVSRHHGINELYLDVESEFSRIKFFNSPLAHKPDFVINCIGVLRVDADKNPARTVLLNSWWPHYLEDLYAHTKTKVIHISTDCIFNGERGWYIENDLPNETELYGRSKALGEINNDKDITLRMSIIGPEIKEHDRRSGLLNWVINGAESKLLGWENSWWSGITTFQLAKSIYEYIQKPDITGVYHLVPSYGINKYHLVSYINDVFDCDKEVVPVPGKDENKILLDTREGWTTFSEIPGYYDQLLELRDFYLVSEIQA